MNQEGNRQAGTGAYWGREGLETAILNALTAAGKDVDALTVDDLAPFDQFHTGGKGSTVRLAKLAGFAQGMRVLDVGGGFGGPARTLAVEFGCSVTVLDLTESYVKTGEALTNRLGLQGQVSHLQGDALNLPFPDASFDAIWTQNACMNISDKEQLYAEFGRLLRPGALLAFQEPMVGPVQPLIFPVMWADDAGGSILRSPAEMKSVIEAAGFRACHWEDVTTQVGQRSTPPAQSIQYLIMGDRLDTISSNGRRNEAEGRLVHLQAVFERI
jgi:ubiquinone/menaquinone biosynthesis C-methylase UbiE